MTAQPERDYYRILGVARNATEGEIRAAFHHLAAEYQAQSKPANVEAVEHFRTIAKAYRILSDVEQRRHYDRLGENGVIEQPLSTRYDDLDELEKRALTGGRYQWPYCDHALARFLDRLLGWD